MTKSKIVRLAIAALVVVLVALFVRHLDWDAIATSVTGASIPLLVVATLGNLPLVWIKAHRLRLLAGGTIPVRRLINIYFASYAADNLVMSQAGLGVRVAMLARTGLPVASAVTTQVVEKVLEGIGLAIVALPLLGSDDLPGDLQTILRVCLAIGAIGAVVLVGLAMMRATPGPHRSGTLRRIAEVAAVLRAPSLAARVAGLTVAAWVVEYAMVVVTLEAMHLPSASLLPLLVLVAVNLAALIPGLPANVGPFEMACVLALGTVGVAEDPALGFALLYHALHTIPVTIVGLLPAIRPDRSPHPPNII